MNNYVTGRVIKDLREAGNMTQTELGDKLGVSNKAISKWETGKGLPDITLVEPLAKALHISVAELLAGEYVINQNKASNMKRAKLYVCPVCKNVVHAIGEASVNCCGIALPALEAEEAEGEHDIRCQRIEDEYFVSINHEMTKEHYISFLAYVTSDRFEMVKLYGEQNAEARFRICGHGLIYGYCNKHGLFKKSI